MAKIRRLIWDSKALDDLTKSLEWISYQSFQEAEKVEESILNKLEVVKFNPERYPPDKYKNSNPGHYRALEIYSFRIAYSYNEDEIRILRVRHVKQEPKEY